jgi:hypothetical protein
MVGAGCARIYFKRFPGLISRAGICYLSLAEDSIYRAGCGMILLFDLHLARLNNIFCILYSSDIVSYHFIYMD